MTYNVFGGTLNLTQSMNRASLFPVVASTADCCECFQLIALFDSLCTCVFMLVLGCGCNLQKDFVTVKTFASRDCSKH